MPDRIQLQSGTGVLQLQSSTDNLLLQDNGVSASTNPAMYEPSPTPRPVINQALRRQVRRVEYEYVPFTALSTAIPMDEPFPVPVTLPPVTIVLSPSPYIPARASAAAIAMEPPRPPAAPRRSILSSNETFFPYSNNFQAPIGSQEAITSSRRSTPRVVRIPEPDVYFTPVVPTSYVVIDETTLIPTAGPVSVIAIASHVYIAPPAIATALPYGLEPPRPQFPSRRLIPRNDINGTVGVAFSYTPWTYDYGWADNAKPVARPSSSRGFLRRDQDSPIITPAVTPTLDFGWSILSPFQNRPKEWVGRYAQAQHLPFTSASVSNFANLEGMTRPASALRSMRRPDSDLILPVAAAYSFWDLATTPPAPSKKRLIVPAGEIVLAANVAASIDWTSGVANWTAIARRVLRKNVTKDELGFTPRVIATPDYGWTMLSRLPIRPLPSKAPYLAEQYLRFENFHFVLPPLSRTSTQLLYLPYTTEAAALPYGTEAQNLPNTTAQD